MNKQNQNKNSRKVQFNLGSNYSDIYAKKKSITKQNKNSNDSILTNTSKSSQNDREHGEEILLLTQVKSMNNSNMTYKYAVLTNLKLCLYNSKSNYLLDKENPYKVFKLQEYDFEINNNILSIQRKEDNIKKTITKNIYIEKYEFSNKIIAKNWNITLSETIKILKLGDEDKNNIDINKSLKNADNHPLNKEKNEINGEKKVKIDEKTNNEDYNDKNYADVSKSNSQSDTSNIKEEEDKNKKDSDNEKYNTIEKDNGDKNESNKMRDIKGNNTKPPFRCLLKEEIKKVEKELFNNNANDIDIKVSDKKTNNNEKSEKKLSYQTPSFSNSIKNKITFGKQADLNFFRKNSIFDDKNKNDKEINLPFKSINNNNQDNNKSDFSNEEKEEDLTENNDIIIKDISQNDISGNDMFNDKTSFINDDYSKNTNILLDENNLKNSFVEKSTTEIIKLIGCDKSSKRKSDSIFELSDSNKEKSNKEKDKGKKCGQINDFLDDYIKENQIKSLLLSKNGDISQEINKNENEYNYDDRNKTVEKSNYSCTTNNYNNYKFEGDSYLDNAFNKIKNKYDNINNRVIQRENEKNSNQKNDFSNISDTNINENNTNNNNLIKNDQFNDINEIKMFDNNSKVNYNLPSLNILNNSILNSPKANDLILEKNSSERRKILLFSKETKINNDKNEYEYERERSNIFSNDKYSYIYDNKTLSNKISPQNKINKKGDNITPKDSGTSLVIVDKNHPLLNKSNHLNNVDKSETKIEKVENLKIVDENQIKIFKNIIIEKQEYFSLFGNGNKISIINEANSIIMNSAHSPKPIPKSISNLKKSFIQDGNNALNFNEKNKFDFRYLTTDKKRYKNNKFIIIKDNCFKTQKVVDFYIEDLNDDSLKIDEIKKEALINNLNYNKKGKVKFKCKSVDSKKNVNYKNYVNAAKENTTHKDIYKKKLNLKKNLLIEKVNNSKNEEPFTIKSHSRNISLNYDYEPFNKDEFLDINNSLCDDTSALTNNTTYFLNQNNNAFFSSRHLNKEIKSTKFFPKKLSKFVNKKSSLNYHSSPKIDIYNKKYHNYSLLEKTFNFNETTIDKGNENAILIKLIENILCHRYSKEMLLFCFNNGMSMTTFLPDFQENIEFIFKNNNENYELILKDLFDVIPKLIRNRLEKKDLKSFFVNNSFFGDCYAKDYIKRLIIKDNKFLVDILNKYFDNIPNIIIKNDLCKCKNKFVQKMKNLTADIIFS